MINEEQTPNGMKITQQAQKKSKSDSDAYYKSVKKKVDSVYGKDGEPEVKPNKYNYSDEAKTVHNELETLNGLEMTEFDNEPNEKFKERAKAAIEGSSIMGNPHLEDDKSTFEKDLSKRVKSSKKKRDDAKLNYVALGDDMELNQKTAKNSPKSLAFEQYTHFIVTNGKIAKGFKLEEGQDLKKTLVESIIPSIKECVDGSSKVYSKNSIKKLGINEMEIDNWLNESFLDNVSYEELKSFLQDEMETAEYLKSRIKDKQIILTGTPGLGTSGTDHEFYIGYKKKMADIAKLKLYLDEKKMSLMESNDYDPDYTHFVIHKPTGTVLFGADFSDLRDEDGRFDNDSVKEYAIHQLEDEFSNEIPKKDAKIITKKGAEKAGLDLSQANSYYSLKQREQGINEGKIKSLKFKRAFGGPKKALTLIPESYKKDKNKFEMTDGNEKYLIRWEGNLNEGTAIILNQENATMIEESYKKIKHLTTFNGFQNQRLNNQEKLREDDLLKFNIKNIKHQIAESKKLDEKKMLSEGVQEKPVKEKFIARKLDLNETVSKYAKIEKANYLKEGNSYEGIIYHISLKENIIPADEIAKEIVLENKYKKPSDRQIKFKFTTETGRTIDL